MDWRPRSCRPKCSRPAEPCLSPADGNTDWFQWTCRGPSGPQERRFPMSKPATKPSSKLKTAITPTRDENYPEWYQDLAENSPVRGCMVIKPWGYSLWENIQRGLDGMFKATGHRNAYFPLFIPLSFLEKEATHVEGFAKECAVITHHRLEAGPDGGLVPAGPLEEPLIVRPTSETIIGAMFAKWVESYRDLPLAHQPVGERRPLGDADAHVPAHDGVPLAGGAHRPRDEDEAVEETMRMLGVYADFAENYMAMPVITGAKSEAERFPARWIRTRSRR